MIKEQKMKYLDNYEKLYEEMKIKYENKLKENEQLKTLLKLRDKEIISLKTKIKSVYNGGDGISNNNNDHEVSKKYIEDLIKIEIENIQKEKLLYRNKILTLENYELQYLAPKLTTGSNHNYQFSSGKSMNKNLNNNIDKIYFSMKHDIRSKNKMYNSIKMNNKNNNTENDSLNESLDYKYNSYSNLNGGDSNVILNGSFSKTLTKSKRKFDV
jgi:hypothetical protein